MSNSISSSSMSGSSSASAASVHSQLEEHSVALATLRDPHAAVAIALHLHTLKSQPDAKCISITDEETQSEKGLPTIPPNWSNNPDGFCFQYLLPSSSIGGRSTTLLVKSIRLDRSLLVHSCVKQPNGQAGKDVYSVEINVDDHINSKALPGGQTSGAENATTTAANPSSSASAPAATPTTSATSSSATSLTQPDFEKLYKDLPALLALYDRNILNKVVPKPEQKSQQQSQPQVLDPMGGMVPPGVNPYPRNPLRPDEDQPEGFDPLRVYPQRGGNRGPFAGDIDPLSGGPAGNLMGPGQFPFGDPRAGGGGLGGPRGPPGMAPRFDPYGPMPGMGHPDFDELLPPGAGGPLADIGGPLGPGAGMRGGPRRGGFGGGGPGFGGPGGGGFGGGGFGGGGRHFM